MKIILGDDIDELFSYGEDEFGKLEDV